MIRASNGNTKAPLFVLLMLFLLTPAARASSDWQQRVDYVIDVTLSDDARELAGRATVTYHNNSPDTLGTLWFRLSPAAQQGGSVVDRTPMRGRHGHLSKVEDTHWGDCQVGEVQDVTGRRHVVFEQEFSVGQLHVIPPLRPGDSLVVELPFTTRFPSGGAQSRMGATRGQLKGAYWYPQICAYTPESGWTVNHYFGTGEAYGEFGDFILRYTVPYCYVIASTGLLLNQDEVLPPGRLAGIDLNNPDPDPVIDGPEGDRLVTWVFLAEDVPDVAFAMDPTFLIDRVEYDGFESWAFMRRDINEDWSDCAEVCGWTIEQLEDIYGDYPWPRVKASYSWSGMEYPMITLATAGAPRYRYFIMHEVIHNYTPMILHSNSVDEQWIDEGFTAFIEHELSARWYRTRWDRERTYTEGLFSDTFTERNDVVRGARPYLEAVLPGEDLPMDRPSDTALDYPLLRASSYYKAPVMLNALRGVVGEDRFWRGFRVLYDRHKLTHVGYQDILTSFQDAAGQDLDWLFEQFVYSDKDIDYAITDFDRERVGDRWRIEVEVKRVGEVRLPVRLGVLTTSGDTLRGEIAFLASTPELPGYERWGTWDQIHMPNDEIEVEVDLPEGVKPTGVILDPDRRYLDRNPLDNQSSMPPIDVEFDPVLWPVIPPPVDAYRVLLGPAAGYDHDTGPLIGVALRGSYMEREAVVLADLLVAPVEPEPVPTRRGMYHADRVHGRIGIAHPFNRDFGPWYGTLYAGRMHDDRFAETGVWRSWRAWATWFDRATVMLRAGYWARDGIHVSYPQDLGPLAPPVQQESWRNDAREVYYLHGRYDLKGSRASWPYYASARLTTGIDAGFSVLSLEGTASKRWFGQLYFGIETRAAALNNGPPERFAPTLHSAAIYRSLGQPLASGAGYFSDARYPAQLAPAVLAGFDHIDTDRFLALRLTQMARMPLAGKANPVSRLFSHIRYGLYEGGAIYHGIHSSNPDKVLRAFEVGVELRIDNLYGVDLSVRRALNESSDATAHDQDVQLWLNVNLDRYFRN